MAIDCPRCEHKHNPSGSDDDDAGVQECDACGFRFYVDIDYEPSYSTSCMEHDYNEPERQIAIDGTKFVCRFCKWCGKCDILREGWE